MSKKFLSISSWVVHGAYALFCLAIIAIFALSETFYPANYDLSATLDQIAGIGGALLSFFPFWIAGSALNIVSLVAQIADKTDLKTNKIVWHIVRTVLCLVGCILLWLNAFAVFMTATGGV